jgi:hypothetical protein
MRRGRRTLSPEVTIHRMRRGHRMLASESTVDRMRDDLQLRMGKMEKTILRILRFLWIVDSVGFCGRTLLRCRSGTWRTMTLRCD